MSSLSLYFISFIVGGLTTGFTLHKLKPTEKTTPPQTTIIESPIATKLTDLELLEIPCSKKYIEEHGHGLCREMFCLMQTRGIDAKVSQTQCESIANINNTLSMLQYCTPTITSNMTKEHLQTIKEEREDCIQFFRERK
tara:strand:+ start:171 stop:587 length:417 start_codon:yes stop_codon:yes gene_type:complete